MSRTKPTTFIPVVGGSGDAVTIDSLVSYTADERQAPEGCMSPDSHDEWMSGERACGCLAAQVPAQEERLREAARAMWYAHTEDERFAGPPSADPYMDFERELLRALVDESKEEA